MPVKLRILAQALLRGFLFFGVVMGFSMGCVMLNARWWPTVAWFPLPVAVFLVAAIVWAQRRWDIGLVRPPSMSTGRIYVIGLGVTIVGISVCILQGASNDMVRETEIIAADVSRSFAMTYAFVMSVVAAILAEATLRGIVQTRMHDALAIWPTIILVAAINTIAHRWGLELAHNWFGLFVIMGGWTFLRWLSQSLWPPLVLHALANLILATVLWNRGPLDHAALGTAALLVVAVVGAGALVGVVALARDMDAATRAAGPTRYAWIRTLLV